MTVKLVHRESECESKRTMHGQALCLRACVRHCRLSATRCLYGDCSIERRNCTALWCVGLWLCSLWCSCVSQFRDICVFLVAFCCTLPNFVRSCLRQHLEQNSFHNLEKKSEAWQWLLAVLVVDWFFGEEEHLGIPRDSLAYGHTNMWSDCLPLTDGERCFTRATGCSILHRSLKGAGGGLPTIHRRISSGQMLLYRTWRL